MQCSTSPNANDVDIHIVEALGFFSMAIRSLLPPIHDGIVFNAELRLVNTVKHR